MSYVTKLKNIRSLHGVARILGYRPSSLSYILYIKTNKYSTFKIKKQSGGEREINAPYPDLRLMQKRLAKILQDCISEINIERDITSIISHGFRRKFSIITNAGVHRKKNYVFNTDLEDFFGTINFGRVRGFFIKNKNFELDPAVATIIAQIACHKNSLPQGSPCSPVISNLIAHSLDINLARLANKTGCHYSRYADDLTFSTNKKIFPEQLATFKQEEEKNIICGKILKKLIEKNGFRINESKTRIQYKRSRQDVTGLVVNKKVSVKKEYWHTVRAMTHSLFQTGEFTINKMERDDDGKLIKNETIGTLNQLNGMLGFINSVDLYNNNIDLENDKEATKNLKQRELNSREKTYQRFLFYKNFLFNSSPIIICEGKTDNIYIDSAMRSLYKKHPNLTEVTDNKKVNLKVKFFNYTKTTSLISKLSGGTGDLSKFISSYKNNCLFYKERQDKHPVIILIDNDKGSRNIFSVINEVTKTSVDGSKDFYFIGENLYIVVIPKIDKKDTMIEDYFDNNVLDVKLHGKSFNPKVPFNKKIEYGKYLFAENVVKKNCDKIDFNAFDSILDRIDAVISHHSKG